MRKFLLAVLVVCSALLLFVQCGKKTDAAIETESKSVDADTAEYFISFSIDEVEYKWTGNPVAQAGEGAHYEFKLIARRDTDNNTANHVQLKAAGPDDSDWTNRDFDIILLLGKDMYTAQGLRLVITDIGAESEVFQATFDSLELKNEQGETKTLSNGVMNFKRQLGNYIA